MATMIVTLVIDQADIRDAQGIAQVISNSVRGDVFPATLVSTTVDVPDGAVIG